MEARPLQLLVGPAVSSVNVNPCVDLAGSARQVGFVEARRVAPHGEHRRAMSAAATSTTTGIVVDSSLTAPRNADEHWAAGPLNASFVGYQDPIRYPNDGLSSTLRKAENPAVIGVSEVARPGLEPGTPRFSVVGRNLSNSSEIPAVEQVITTERQRLDARIAFFSRRFGH